jgi:uncharacterized 2Fe-2S/4Fe-4S cluster protein (DUF4445 family)
MRLTIQPFKKKLKVQKNILLLTAISFAGINLRTDCGGIGKCGKCKVICSIGLSPKTLFEKKNLGPEELRKGVRLACQARILKSTQIFIPPASLEGGIRILVDGILKGVKPDPLVLKRSFKAPIQRSEKEMDWETIQSKIESDSKRTVAPTLSFLKTLSEKESLKEGKTFYVSIGEKIVDIGEADDHRPVFGLALDIGTTTMVAYLHDLSSGGLVSVSSLPNPQSRYGWDVVARIQYAVVHPNGLKLLNQILIDAINEMIQEASQMAGISREEVFEICAVGNTTMHHLFLGLRPKTLTHFPYTPLFRKAIALRPKEVGIRIHPEGQIYLLPLVAGFMGSDTVGVVLSTRLYKSKRVKLAIDIGTNGEIVLGNRDRMVAASCAAGPAFEGGQIRFGMPGSRGAIDSLSIDEKDEIHLHAIDDYPPIGICGSGLVDAASELNRKGLIDSSGRILRRSNEINNRNLFRHIIKVEDQHAFLLSKGTQRGRLKNIYLTQKDVRELQLAKAAIWAGIQILMKTLGKEIQDIDELFLAGAFGNYIRPESAIQIGLLPPVKKSKIRPVGNAAGTGARMALTSLKERIEADQIAQQIEYVELAKHPDFQKIFIEGMSFPF